MDYRRLFEANLALLDRVIASVCRRGRLFGPDAEDFASTAKLALMENDYAVLRPFEGRSSLFTFLVVIVHRLLLDERTRRSGRWHPSREAERLGAAGVALENIVRREQRSIDEALPVVQAIDPTLTRDRVAEMENRLPQRMPRPRNVELSDVEAHLTTANRTDQRVLAADAERLSERISGAIRDAMEEMTLEDRMIIRFHFGSSFTIAETAGLLRLPQRPLYRRVEALLQRLRKKLSAEGIAAGDVADLIGSATAEMDFGLKNGKREDARPTNTDGTQREVEEAG